MPLSSDLMEIVCNTLRNVPDDPHGAARRRAFDAMLPLLGLSSDEVDAEFSGVQSALRYVRNTERDLAWLSRFRLPRRSLPCRVQASLTSRARLC